MDLGTMSEAHGSYKQDFGWAISLFVCTRLSPRVNKCASPCRYFVSVSFSLEREEGPGHIELSPWWNLAMTNQICAVHRLHSLSWSST